jgi:adenosyl cobinamide kinase/adenosyl cobinamide phosphate guanylyltransferase
MHPIEAREAEAEHHRRQVPSSCWDCREESRREIENHDEEYRMILMSCLHLCDYFFVHYLLNKLIPKDARLQQTVLLTCSLGWINNVTAVTAIIIMAIKKLQATFAICQNHNQVVATFPSFFILLDVFCFVTLRSGYG